MEPVAVLASGGLDSSVLLAELAGESQVHPLYVRAGLAWEEAELAALGTFLEALGQGGVRPLVVLEAGAGALYGEHWSLSGLGAPSAGEPDSAMFLPGRNVLLIAMAAVWCSTHGVSRIAIGSLGGNPFPDATPRFFQRYGEVLSQGLAHRVAVEAPFRGLRKEEVVERGRHLPLHLTVACAAPVRGVHCGRCNKCEERRRAFQRAGVVDGAAYAA